MPNLGDFIGELIGEVALARFRADAETARIAEIYASHELLKHFSVPRYRLPEVNIEVPAIFPEEDVDTEMPGKLRPNQVLPLFESAFEQALVRQGISTPPSAPWRKTLGSRINRELREILSSDLQPTAEKIADKLLGAVGKVPKISQEIKEALPKITKELRQDLIQRILAARASATRIQVIVSTASIREVSDPDRIVRLRLSLREDSVEWVTIETEQGSQQRLVPE